MYTKNKQKVLHLFEIHKKQETWMSWMETGKNGDGKD